MRMGRKRNENVPQRYFRFGTFFDAYFGQFFVVVSDRLKIPKKQFSHFQVLAI